MSTIVYLRPLQIEDALTSYRWRNDPKIWRFTGSRPDKEITADMETAWLSAALKRGNEKRYAICLCEDDTYIGNVFFTDINNQEAQMHIFIGEVRYWGKTRAYDACWLAFVEGFTNLDLTLVYMEMHKNNPGVGEVKRMGWQPVKENENGFIKYVFTTDMFEQKRERLEADKNKEYQ